jgi:hypothetical protein
MLNVKNIIIALIVGMFVGLCAGFYVKAKFDQAAQVQVLSISQKNTAANIVQSQKTDTTLTTAIVGNDARIASIKTAIDSHFKGKQNDPPVQPSTTAATSVSCLSADDSGNYLDYSTVRMLNAAATASSLGSTASGNAKESITPQATGQP